MAQTLSPAPTAPSDVGPDVVRRPRRPTLDDVWASLPVLVPMLVSLLRPMVAVDLAYQVRTGDLILSGGIPSVDTFTFTVAGAPWLDQQWGAQLLLAIGHRGGFAAVAVLRAALIGASFGLLFLACRARGASTRTSSLLSLVGFFVCLQAQEMRPQLFGLLFFAASVWLLAGRGAHPRRTWWLVAIGVLWANAHGSFVFLPVLCGLASVEDALRHDPRWRATAALSAVCALATLVNPFGVQAWMYVAELSNNPVIRRTITEWAPMSVSTFAGVAFFSTALAIAGWMARRTHAVGWADLLWLGAFFVLALPALRGVLWWAVIAPFVMAGLLAPRATSATVHPAGVRAMNLAVLTTLALATVAMVPWGARPPSTMLSEAPGGLSAATREILPAGSNVFVPQPWGSWFELDAPQHRVFLDARIELFPQAVWDDYHRVQMAGTGWETVLDRWSADAVVVERDQSWERLTAELDRSTGWCLAAGDADGSLYVRETAFAGACATPL